MINFSKSIRSFKFAKNGICIFFKDENNARVHLLASIIVLVAGFYFELNRNEWLWITLAIAVVWITEAMNTAIEKIV
jgi:diacylglycerol kinase